MFSFLIFWGIGSALLGFFLAWFMQRVDKKGTPKHLSHPKGKKSKNGNDINKAQIELEKIKKRYDSLYDSKLDVDTALVTAESTLDGLKLDYEKLERDLSGNNNRHKELQHDFDSYKNRKENEIKDLRLKTKKATDKYETAKFQLAKSNRINEKLQESLMQLKDENDKLSTEIEDANEEIEVVNASMAQLKNDYQKIKNKTNSYNDKLSEWKEKYKNLDITLQDSVKEKVEISKAYESYQASTNSEIQKLSSHLTSLQAKLEDSSNHSNEYLDAYNQADADRLSLAKELEEEKKKATKELIEIQNNLKDLEKDYVAVKKREQILDDRFENLQDKHSTLEDAFQNTVEEKENLELAYNQYMESSNEKFTKLETEAKTWVKKLESSNHELAQNKEKAKELEKNKKQLAKELDKMRERYNKERSMSGGEFDALNDTFENLKKRYFDINKELSSTKLEKDRISHEHETLQEQVLAELDLIRNENKKLAKLVRTIKAEKRILEFSKAELQDRIEELEKSNVSTGVHGQDKLIKMINRLMKNVEEQQKEIAKFEKEKIRYQEKILSLEMHINNGNDNENNTRLQEINTIDDLKEIIGIDTMVEETLHDFGIFNFEQFADISVENKDLLSKVISTPPKKITQWVKQAKELLEKGKAV
ncbi:MAG: hypothetical protein MK207_10315 [Saprospiraceae bacterium]|nr:hypothetical protein [Saprospiraceae bacterium]